MHVVCHRSPGDLIKGRAQAIQTESTGPVQQIDRVLDLGLAERGHQRWPINQPHVGVEGGKG